MSSPDEDQPTDDESTDATTENEDPNSPAEETTENAEDNEQVEEKSASNRETVKQKEPVTGSSSVGASKKPKSINKSKPPLSKTKTSQSGQSQAISSQKRVKAKNSATNGKSNTSIKPKSKNAPKKIKSATKSSVSRTKSKPVSRQTIKSKPSSSARKTNKSAKPSAPTRTKSKPMSVRSSGGKSNQTNTSKTLKIKSKGTGPVKVIKSKPAASKATTVEKSTRSSKSRPDQAEDIIRKIIQEMKTKSSASKVGQSSSISDRSSTSGSVASSNSGSAKSKGKCSSQAKTNKSTGKSNFSSTVTATQKEKTKHPKRTTPAKRPTESTPPSSKETTSSTGKVTQEDLTKLQVIAKQMKLDPTMAKAVVKCWPELISTLKEQQQVQEASKNATTTPEALTNDEMEDLNDELSDLNTSINTLRHSYGSIIRSLVNMQRRRDKKKTALGSVPTALADSLDAQVPEGGTLVQSNTVTDICNRITINYEEKYSMEKFMDCTTRNDVFEQLFREVNEINSAFLPLKKFYDVEGYFQVAQYRQQAEFVLTRAQYTDCIKVVSVFGNLMFP